MEKSFFGTDKHGREIYRYTLTDENGNSLSVLNYGATIQSLIVTDKNGVKKDVVMGFDNLAQYEDDTDRTYFGAICGRVGNRIANAEFYVEGEKYTLAKNNGNHCLHGGTDGFDKKFFDLTDADEDYMTFSVFSPDGDEGFPGNVSLSVKYTFRGGLLMLEYMATTTATCPVSFSNHTYFNLDGEGDIRNHKLQLNSHYYMPVDESVLATGVVRSVEGTPFDFLTEKELGPAIDAAAAAQPSVKGIDHHFFCDNGRSEYRRFLGQLRDKYPRAHIVCTTTILGHHENWDKAIDQVCCEMRQADARVHHFLYTKNGCGTPGHIRGSEAAVMAQELAAFIEGLDGVWAD